MLTMSIEIDIDIDIESKLEFLSTGILCITSPTQYWLGFARTISKQIQSGYFYRTFFYFIFLNVHIEILIILLYKLI